MQCARIHVNSCKWQLQCIALATQPKWHFGIWFGKFACRDHLEGSLQFKSNESNKYRHNCSGGCWSALFVCSVCLLWLASVHKLWLGELKSTPSEAQWPPSPIRHVNQLQCWLRIIRATSQHGQISWSHQRNWICVELAQYWVGCRLWACRVLVQCKLTESMTMGHTGLHRANCSCPFRLLCVTRFSVVIRSSSQLTLS